jgi:hypothetical protein
VSHHADQHGAVFDENSAANWSDERKKKSGIVSTTATLNNQQTGKWTTKAVVGPVKSIVAQTTVVVFGLMHVCFINGSKTASCRLERYRIAR